MNLAAINAAIKNGNAVAMNLANEDKFVESGCVHSLTQIIRVLYNENQALLSKAKEAAEQATQLRSVPTGHKPSCASIRSGSDPCDCGMTA